MPPNTRDNLYQGLPPTMKAALRVRLQQSSKKDEVRLKSSLSLQPLYMYMCIVEYEIIIIQLVLLLTHEAVPQLSMDELKCELYKILDWLVPVASNTTKSVSFLLSVFFL